MQGLRGKQSLFGEAFLSEDGKEGIDAFINKREPSF